MLLSKGRKQVRICPLFPLHYNLSMLLLKSKPKYTWLKTFIWSTIFLPTNSNIKIANKIDIALRS